VRSLLRLQENQELQGYDRKTHPFALALTALIGEFKYSSLLATIKQLEADPNVRCPRDAKRSEPLMVKWLYDRRHLLSNFTPVIAAGTGQIAVGQLPLDDDFDQAGWFEGADQDTWDRE
jgi:hypothetical protein